MIAALLNLGRAYDYKFRNSRSRGQFLLTGKRRTSQFGHNNTKTVTPDRCPRVFMIPTEEKFYFACRNVYFMSRFPALCLLFCDGEKCTGKDASNEACHNYGIFLICSAWQSAACSGRNGKKHPSAPLCFLNSVSCISQSCHLFCIKEPFSMQYYIINQW